MRSSLLEYKQEDMTRKANGKHFIADILWCSDSREWVKYV